MQPIKLTLEGFGSYVTATEIPLGDVTLAAITGANGAGKSTMWDALIYALYGKTRTGGRDADGVVSLGSDQASVSFEFDLSGIRWRANRTRIRGKRTTALLEVYDPESLSGWTARSDGSVKNTDAAIEDLLGMSADTFLATVMVGQGDADRFTSSDPAKRKQVLHEVLGLDAFAVWGKRAKDHRDEVKQQITTLNGRAEPLLEKVRSRDTVQGEFDTASESANAARTAADRAEERRSEADRRLHALETDLANLAAARDRADRLAREAAEKARAAEAARRDAEDAKRKAEAALADAETKLDKSRRAADAIERLQSEADRAAGTVDSVMRDMEQVREEGTSVKVEAGQAETEVARLADAIAEREERADGLEKARTSGDPSCWVCAQSLPHETAETMAADLRDEITRLRDDHAAAQERHRTLSARLTDLRARHEALKSQAATERDTLDKARQNVDLAKSEAALLDERAANRDRCEEQVTDADAKIAASVDGTVTEPPELVEARAEIDRLTTATADADMLRSAVRTSEDAVKSAKQNYEGALTRKAALQQQLDDIDSAELALGDLTDQISEHTEEQSEWDAMVTAFSKDGVPALITASVVPELEQQTNEILGLLSNGTLMVRLETEKESKSGTTKDTLDIAVVSAEGERDYATFSGGERLRIDLALRIGLSRLLANRSGTQMRTLVIDEGWGALDNDGVVALSDCLRTLQESGEFGAVFTVTHIPEIATAFPQQVMVSRDIEGFSEVRISNN